MQCVILDRFFMLIRMTPFPGRYKLFRINEGIAELFLTFCKFSLSQIDQNQ